MSDMATIFGNNNNNTSIAGTVAADTLYGGNSTSETNTGNDKSPALSAGYEGVEVEVRTDDLNLATNSGRDSLDRRIESAARQACGSSDANAALADRMHQKACLANARTKAKMIAAARISQTSALAAR